MPTPMKRTLTAVPMPVFLAMLHSAQDRADRERRQNSPSNDGRTGFIVNY
jgi:hypothetical protein